MGHALIFVIKYLNKLGYLDVTSALPNPTVCSSRQLTKNRRLPFILNKKRVLSILELVHCDLWGPAPIGSLDGFQYYIVFMDDLLS